MSTTTWKSTSDTNYLNAADWTNGAPVAGSTVIIPESTAPATATNLAITNEQISLTGTGTFTGNGTTSFDAATTLSGAPMNGNIANLDDNFVNNGTITNVTLQLLAGPANNTASIDVVNNGTITYNTVVSASGGNYIDGSDQGAAVFANNGTFNVISQPGATNTLPPTGPTPPIPTTVEWGSPFSGTGTVNIVGGSPNSTTQIPFVTGAPQQAYMQFDFGAVVSGSLTFNVNDGYVTFGSPVSGATFNYQDASGVVRFTSGSVIGTGITVTGFRAGDVLDIGTAVNSAGISYNTTTDILSYTDTNNQAHSIKIVPTGTQVYTAASFVVDNNGTYDGIGEPEIYTTAAAPCYCPGTMILTNRGEVAVEALAIGDRLMTASGPKRIVWIGRRAFDGRFIGGRQDLLPVCIRAGALGDQSPRRDLWVSPLHAMFLNGVLVPAHALVNGVSVTQAEAVDRVEYIHLELKQHDVIWAEGALSETFVDDHSRLMFQNAAEYDALYPGREPVEAVYCAPRVVDGEALDVIKRAIDLRAGCAVTGAGEPLEGWLDGVAGSLAWGWARNPARPDVPVCIEILVDGAVVSRAVASGFRKDLAEAGLGSGRHAFKVDLPASITSRSVVEVRRVSDRAILSCHWRQAA